MIPNPKKILQEICASFNPVFVTKLYHGPAQKDAIANAWKYKMEQVFKVIFYKNPSSFIYPKHNRAPTYTRGQKPNTQR